MELLIVTGMSGAGKSKAMDILEDIGFFCVDNMPPKLMPSFAQLLVKSAESIKKAAIVVDTRSIGSINDIFESIENVKEYGVYVKIMFIDASTQALVNRYKETRRKHPLAYKFKGSLDSAVKAEREVLRQIRSQADFTIDTTHLSPNQLKDRVAKLFLDNISDTLHIQCMSFGFKYGVPTDSDLVFDVRCLPNPFYVEELKGLTGLDERVREYVMGWEQAKGLAPKLLDLIDYLVPLYREEGKSQLMIAIGCTGGKHRSVVFSELICKHLSDEKGQIAMVTHRDIGK
ncbi:MAG: RNase adapter RapZ [Oscillospiraceae bacterium]|jgi:UPF0042 nucleotide-binding protein|nr:RNase adapter RapZ [Oscillospiraceae bacterium]